jgi:PhzF family phenazine biosynthesis protein
MTTPLFHVDAFTNRPFAGNPAAVCILPAWKDPGRLQGIAAEMNLSETAFLVQQQGAHFELRWFTPKVEVDLCGHATLASAHVIWEQGLAEQNDEIHFSTRSGILKAARRGDSIELDFPLTPEQPATAPPELVEALGVPPLYVGKGQFDYLVEVESETVLRGMKPNFKRLVEIHVRGVIVTSRSADPKYDFVSRFFAPGAGIDEDPVTGSAHCCLGAYWQKRLEKNEFLAYQASARGGVVRVRVANGRAYLGGNAVTVARGELVLKVDVNDSGALQSSGG